MHAMVTVKLAGRDFAFSALTISALSRIYDAAMDSAAHPIARNAAIVAAALAQDHPGERLDDTVRPTIRELGTAATAVLRLSGLSTEETSPGEAAAPLTGA